MGELYIGTSGYDYTEWRGVLYPQELPREEFLAFYSGHFNALELNYSYYCMPDEYQMTSMIKRSGGKVAFSVKAHQSMTHTITVSTWRDRAHEFSCAMKPLANRNLLLSVLLQFPQSFHYEEDERRYLDALVTELGELPLVIEFRHNSWQNPRVQEALAKRNIGSCIPDMPKLRSLPKALPQITGTNAYIRFHGRNSGSWHGTDARERYNYLYSEQELQEYVPVIRQLSGSSKLVQIYFNNHAKGQAVINAQKMKVLLAQDANTNGATGPAK